jgi:hypothetical protein
MNDKQKALETIKQWILDNKQEDANYVRDNISVQKLLELIDKLIAEK